MPDPMPQDLIVRQHERVPCDLPARIRLAPASVRIIRLTPAASSTGELAARVVDLSRGGAGLSSAIYLPVRSSVVVVVHRPGGEPIELNGQIRRATMMDKRPHYYLGVEFADLTPNAERRIAALLAQVRSERAAGEPARA